MALSPPHPAVPWTKLRDLVHSWGGAGRDEGVEQNPAKSAPGSLLLPAALAPCLPPVSRVWTGRRVGPDRTTLSPGGLTGRLPAPGAHSPAGGLSSSCLSVSPSGALHHRLLPRPRLDFCSFWREKGTDTAQAGRSGCSLDLGQGPEMDGGGGAGSWGRGWDGGAGPGWRGGARTAFPRVDMSSLSWGTVGLGMGAASL